MVLTVAFLLSTMASLSSRQHCGLIIFFCRPIPVKQEWEFSSRYISFTHHCQSKFCIPLDTISTPQSSSPSWGLLSFGTCSFEASLSSYNATTKTAPRSKFRLFPDRLDLTMPVDAAIWCFFLLSPFSLFSKSQTLLCPQPLPLTLPRDVCHDNTQFTRSSAVLCIKLSKTIQHIDHLLFVPLPSFTGSDLCPVSAVLHIAQNGRTFVHIYKLQWRVIRA